jgi:hypothetical protein
MRSNELFKLTDFKNTLNPKIWQNNNLKREVEFKLLLISKAFIKFINIPNLKLKDITLSGSNASYNYNDLSDIDLHLVVDTNTDCGKELTELFLAKKSLFNDQHDISIRGQPVEVYVQDSNQQHISNGIYSVVRDKWIKQPKKITAKPDLTNIEHKHQILKSQIDDAINSNDISTIEKLQTKIKQIRQSGLKSGGEFSVENLTFKLLRNDGSLDKLWTAKKSSEDKRLSL